MREPFGQVIVESANCATCRREGPENCSLHAPVVQCPACHAIPKTPRCARCLGTGEIIGTAQALAEYADTPPALQSRMRVALAGLPYDQLVDAWRNAGAEMLRRLKKTAHDSDAITSADLLTVLICARTLGEELDKARADLATERAEHAETRGTLDKACAIIEHVDCSIKTVAIFSATMAKVRADLAR